MSIAQRGVSHSMPALQEFHDSTLYLIRAETAVANKLIGCHQIFMEDMKKFDAFLVNN
ncbi:hypothetical protein PN450_08370 [Dolichospermum lemmermannii CS-548]|uniref:hypothetical protein n=1 Tax=Dolichospermum lemmermannii TaxID=54295 RepID=UPI00232EEC4D|nr:hypothetical protein [Dolichospermum lemmermannii]MDB9436819.1 hypothetical protein [Dolichospermum lemmermannii CS-548]